MKIETSGFHHSKARLELVLEDIILSPAVESRLYTDTRSATEVVRQGKMRRAACLCTILTELLAIKLYFIETN